MEWSARSHRQVFTVAEAKAEVGMPVSSLYPLLNQLLRKGWLIRLAKGKYLVVPMSVRTGAPYTGPAFLIGAALAGKPYYIGFWSILNYYGYTEQFPSAVFVATRNKRREANIHGVTYTFVRLAEHKFFGMREIEEDGQKVTVSDREKTILDCLDHPEYCGGILEAAKGVYYGHRDWDWNRMMEYIDRLGNSAVARRLGYLMEFFKVGSKEHLETLQKRVHHGYVLLDPFFSRQGKRLHRWRLIANVPDYSLKAIGMT